MNPWPDPNERKAIVDEARELTRQRLSKLGELPSKNAPRYVPKKKRRSDAEDTNA